MKNLLIFGILLLALSSTVFATTGKINLLAMSENATNNHGIVAELDLEIKEGSGRVFVETFPLTKLSTQASLRFAQQIACDTVNIDCSQKDFFWTIRALPGIVGGPSAGGSAAVLASALLMGEEIPEDVATTGTINSGGIIGPVGGIKPKINAAQKAGIKTLFLPPGNITVKNKSISAQGYAKDKGIDVIEIYELGEILNETIGFKIDTKYKEIDLDERYSRIMNQVSQDLCKRSEEIQEQVLNVSPNIINDTRRAKNAYNNGSLYAAASFCFRANVGLRNQQLKEQNLTEDQKLSEREVLLERIRQAKQKFKNYRIGTLTDLQTYMAVMERLEEAEELLQLKNETLNIDNLAFAQERYFSAITWARFFDGEGEQINLSDKKIKESCIEKLGEAEERINYIASLLEKELKSSRLGLEKGRKHLLNGDYIMCLHLAAQAKGEANVVMNLLGVGDKEVTELLERKLRITNNAIAESLEKEMFPIIAYSYLDYAISLKEIDRVSSLLFSEYALELSNLDIYFPEPKKQAKEIVENNFFENRTFSFLVGVLLGGLLVYYFLKR